MTIWSACYRAYRWTLYEYVFSLACPERVVKSVSWLTLSCSITRGREKNYLINLFAPSYFSKLSIAVGTSLYASQFPLSLQPSTNCFGGSPSFPGTGSREKLAPIGTSRFAHAHGSALWINPCHIAPVSLWGTEMKTVTPVFPARMLNQYITDFFASCYTLYPAFLFRHTMQLTFSCQACSDPSNRKGLNQLSIGEKVFTVVCIGWCQLFLSYPSTNICPYIQAYFLPQSSAGRKAGGRQPGKR